MPVLHNLPSNPTALRSASPRRDRSVGGPSGSALFLLNGASFSGADIKAVIHLADKNKGPNSRLARIKKALERHYEDLVAREAELASLITSGTQRTVQTSDAERLNRIQILIDTRDNINRAINTVNTQIQELTGAIERSSRESTIELAEIQTLSVSVHREKFPVRSVGAIYPKGFTRGPRTIAGTMVFTVFHQHVLYSILEAYESDAELNNPTTALVDQLPPFDVTIVFANEYGQTAKMSILGCEFTDEGQVMSIQDIFMENTVNFVARDFDPMRAVSERVLDENSRLTAINRPLTAGELLTSDDYQNFRMRINPLERMKARNNPFV